MPKVVLFKSEGDNTDIYVSALQKNGFVPTFVATLDFHYKNIELLRDRLLSPELYSGLIFTSPRSVQGAKIALNGKPVKQLWHNLDNYCVGEVSHTQIKADLQLETKGQESGNASNLADFMKEDLREKIVCSHFLFPCGNLKQDTLQNKLAEYGYGLEPVEIYETIPHSQLEEHISAISIDEEYEFMLFFSPSGVSFCSDLFKRINYNLSRIKIIAIGPSTKKAIENRGLTVFGTAEKPSPEHVIKAMLDNHT